jgi:hypothetical protein
MNFLFAPKVSAKFYSRQDGELIARKLLQVLDPLDVDDVMIGDCDEINTGLHQSIDNLLVRDTLVAVVKGRRGVEMQIPPAPLGANWPVPRNRAVNSVFVIGHGIAWSSSLPYQSTTTRQGPIGLFVLVSLRGEHITKLQPQQ